jgi:hypothetical protein
VAFGNAATPDARSHDDDDGERLQRRRRGQYKP